MSARMPVHTAHIDTAGRAVSGIQCVCVRARARVCVCVSHRVQAHVACLTEWLYDALTKVRHTNGRPLVRVFGKHGSAHHREVSARAHTHTHTHTTTTVMIAGAAVERATCLSFSHSTVRLAMRFCVCLVCVLLSSLMSSVTRLCPKTVGVQTMDDPDPSPCVCVCVSHRFKAA